MDTDNSFKSNESLRLMLIIFLFVFLISSPMWVSFPFTDTCTDKNWGICLEGKSKLCDATELCCNGTIIPGQLTIRNCTETNNNTVIMSRCSNGLWIDLNNCNVF